MTEMENMIQRLKQAGIRIEPGMSQETLDRAEATFGFRCPREIREFLSCGVPVGEDFFDYRDLSGKNIEKFQNFQDWIRRHFHFDLENNRQEMLELLGDTLDFSGDAEGFEEAVMAYLAKSPRLIPFFAHRCFFDGLDGRPIVSFWQPTDTIFYGSDLEDYLEAEFLGKEAGRAVDLARMADTGIWRDLIW